LITARADRLGAILARRDTLRVDVHRVDSFQTREKQLRRAVEFVEPLARACALLRAHGELVPGAAERVRAAVQQVAALRELYTSNRDAFIDPKQAEFRRFESVLSQACEEIDEAALTAWRRYLAHHRPALSDETLNVLSRVPAFAAYVRTIRDLGVRLTRLGDELPSREEAFREVERIEARVREAWDALDSAALSPPVVEFLRASSTADGAPLALLTPEVLDWIDEHLLGKDFRVRVGDTGGHL
jgi:hypothetical protein